MRRVGIAGVLVVLGACGDSSRSRETGSQAPSTVASPAATTVPAAPAEPAGPPAARAALQETLAAVPVRLGGDESMDACGGGSKVVTREQGRKYVLVRSGPGAQYAVIDSVPLGILVADCDIAGQGKWTGVVYDQNDDDLDCGTGSPIPEQRAYQGPCKSGWISGDELELVAG